MAKKSPADYVCLKEAEIASIATTMKAISKVVFGNGKDGLNITVPLLSKSVDNLVGDMEEDRIIRKEMRTTLSAMMKFQDEECLKSSLKDDDFEKREKIRDRKVVVYMAVIATMAIIIPIILAVVL